MYHKESPLSIQWMFNSIAKRYDLTNAVVSLSLHRLWNRALVRKMMQTHPCPSVMLDLCSGTGDIAYHFLRKTSAPCHAYLVDFSTEMLELAKRKGEQMVFPQTHQLSYVEANVQELPFSNESADCTTMAYGIRNVKNPSVCIQEVFRVLKPGGSFGILELTRPSFLPLRIGHKIYTRTLLPLMGKWLTNNQEAYRYLCQSIQTFIEPKKMEEFLKQAGFIKTGCHPLWGGIATLILGVKPH